MKLIADVFEMVEGGYYMIYSTHGMDSLCRFPNSASKYLDIGCRINDNNVSRIRGQYSILASFTFESLLKIGGMRMVNNIHRLEPEMMTFEYSEFVSIYELTEDEVLNHVLMRSI